MESHNNLGKNKINYHSDYSTALWLLVAQRKKKYKDDTENVTSILFKAKGILESHPLISQMGKTNPRKISKLSN